MSGETVSEVPREVARELGADVARLVDEGQEMPKHETEVLHKAVFDEVDDQAAFREAFTFVGESDLEKLFELSEVMEENINRGLEKGGEIFVELLNLSYKPKVEDKTLGKGTYGSCYYNGRRVESIFVDVEKYNGDTDEILRTLAHEYWHAYQRDLADKVGTKEAEELSEEELSKAVLYKYNFEHYVKAEVDYAAYSSQLVEVEARSFEAVMGFKLQLEKGRKAQFVAENPEIYGEENRQGIEREVGGVLEGLDLDRFVEKAGFRHLDELWNIYEDERVANGYAQALSDLVELRQPLGVEFVDELDGGKRLRVDYRSGQVKVRRDKTRDLDLISKLPEIVWRARQREAMLEHSNNERGDLYLTNKRLFIKDTKKSYEEYKRQLLVRERDYFVDELLDILDEQGLMEDVEMMSEEDQRAAREELREKEWRPVKSEKYDVKRKGRNGREG